jgi:hypothetical protein
MKFSIVGLSACLILALSACSQKVDEAKVPAEVKASFAKQFPGVTATWEKENGKYEANFKTNNNEESALFELNGTMTESESVILETELPAAVQTYVTDNYKGKKIKSAAKITNADGSINYEAEVNDKDLLFDAAGNFLKVAEE